MNPRIKVLASRIDSTPSEVAKALLEIYDTNTAGSSFHFRDQLAKMESEGEINQLQRQIADAINKEALLPPYCRIEILRGEWAVQPYFAEELVQIDGHPDVYGEEYYLVSTAQHVQLVHWEESEYVPVWTCV